MLDISDLCLALRFSDHQLTRHGGRDVQEAGEGTRLLCDCCGRGEEKRFTKMATNYWHEGKRWPITEQFFSNYRIVCQSIEEFLFQNQTVYAAQQHGKKK